MTHPSTTREALILEAIADAARLIGQVHTLTPALNESCQALADAGDGLLAQLAAFDSHVVALSEKAKLQMVKYILARTEEAARRSVDAQTQAMSAAAQDLFRTEIGPALQQVAAPLQQIAGRVKQPGHGWLTHAATAAVASALTWVLAAGLWFG
jgi:uncharacterized protein (DUF885 family)